MRYKYFLRKSLFSYDKSKYIISDVTDAKQQYVRYVCPDHGVLNFEDYDLKIDAKDIFGGAMSMFAFCKCGKKCNEFGKREEVEGDEK